MVRCGRVLGLAVVLFASGSASIGCRSAAAIDSPDLDVAAAPSSPREPLRAPGTVTASLPVGDGMDAVRSRCVACHEPAMLRQQRLTAQQWMVEIEKMQGWGAQVPDDDKTRMASYLVTIAGPGNTNFTPAIVAPASTD